FCPGQKNFRQGFAKLKYRWLQSSRLKMSRYSLFCVYILSFHKIDFYRKILLLSYSLLKFVYIPSYYYIIL
ncbi:hypothetical protein DWX73_13100, partial [Coprococcus sp. AF21-14LB]